MKRTLIVVGALLLAGCGDDGGGASAEPAVPGGTEGGACNTDGTCDGALLCLESVCTNDGGTLEEGLPPAPDMGVLAENVIILGDDSGVGLVDASEDGTVELAATGTEPITIAVGDVILSPPEKGGLMVKVTEVISEGGTTVVATEQAALDDIFDEASVRTEAEIDWDNATFTGPLADQVEIVDAAPKGDVTPVRRFKMPLKELALEMGPIALKLTNGVVTIEGAGRFDWTYSRWSGQRDVYVGITSRTTVTFDVEISASAKASEDSHESDTYVFMEVPFLVTIPPIPWAFPFTLYGDIKWQTKAEVKGELTVGATIVGTVTNVVGFRYDGDQVTKVSKQVRTLTPTLSKIELKGDMAIATGPRVGFSFKLLKLAGPEFGIWAAEKFSASVTLLGEGAVDAVIKLFGVLEAEGKFILKIFRWQLPELTVKLVSHEWLQTELRKCFPICGLRECGGGGCPVDKYPELKDHCGTCDDGKTCSDVGVCTSGTVKPPVSTSPKGTCNGSDRALIEADPEDVLSTAFACWTDFPGSIDDAASCLCSGGNALSGGCCLCVSWFVDCPKSQCAAECKTSTEACDECSKAKCIPPFASCAGVQLPAD